MALRRGDVGPRPRPEDVPIPVLEHALREEDGVAHAPQAGDGHGALGEAPRDHDAGFELVAAVAREDGAVAAVEEGVVFEEGDGVAGGGEGRGEGWGGGREGGVHVGVCFVELEIEGGLVDVGGARERTCDGQEAVAVLLVERWREARRGDVACAAMDDDAGFDVGGRG